MSRSRLPHRSAAPALPGAAAVPACAGSMPTGTSGWARSLRRGLASVAVFAGTSVGLVVSAPFAAALPPSPCTDGSTPAVSSTVSCTDAGSYTLTVPAGTTSVDVDVIGGGGGAGYPARSHIGGNAAEVAGTLTLPTGVTIPCRIMDVSLSGAAVATTTTIATGTPVVLGRTHGRVVRQIEGGFAVEFSRIQNPDTLERDICGIA